jgi:hypothetical protein
MAGAVGYVLDVVANCFFEEDVAVHVDVEVARVCRCIGSLLIVVGSGVCAPDCGGESAEAGVLEFGWFGCAALMVWPQLMCSDSL